MAPATACWSAALVGIVTLFGVALMLRDADNRPSHPHPPSTPPATTPADTLDPQTVLDDLLEAQLAEAEALPAGDILDGNDGAQAGTPPRASDVYVPMDVAVGTPDKVNLEALKQLCFHRHDQARPIIDALTEAIAKATDGLRLVLLGEAGAGKSSVVGQLIFRASHPDRPGERWPDALRSRRTLRLNLARLAGAEAADGDPPEGTAAFWAAVAVQIDEQWQRRERERRPRAPRRLQPGLVDQVVARLRGELTRNGLLLLDGLDELLDEGRRLVVKRLIEALGRQLGPDCVLLVTARPYVYPDAALTGFQVWQLQGLGLGDAKDQTGGQVGALVRNWHRVLGRPADEADALVAALRQGRDGADPAARTRAEMAARPLLLTLLLLLAIDRARAGADQPLPAGRAELLEESTRLFIHRWLLRVAEVAEALPAPVRDGLGPATLRNLLEDLSLRVQQAPDRPDADAAELQVPAQWLREALWQQLPDDLTKAELKAVGRIVLQRAGLLFARGGIDAAERYGYIHRQFQEHLAACGLARRAPDALERDLPARVAADPARWREVLRLLALRLACPPDPDAQADPRPPQPSTSAAIALIEALLPPPAERNPDAAYQRAVAAGLALLDLRAALPAPVLADRRVDLDRTKQAFDAWLLALTQDPDAAPASRLELGRVAGRLGDPRPGIIPAGWTPQGAFELRLDDFDWVWIPPGRFTPGSPADDPFAEDNELGGEPVDLHGFWISRYPVTWAMFDAFVRAGGYGGADAAEPPPWWGRVSAEAEGWWRRSERRPRLPGNPGYADWVLPNHPVTGIAWWEAMAFCCWLNERLLERDQLRPDALIRLPSEIEWERAAAGPERRVPGLPPHRRWPWGDDWSPGMANAKASDHHRAASLDCPTAPGLFPFPSAVEGVHDLAGNCWEWTLTRWGDDFDKPSYGWPLPNGGDDRDDPRGDELRIVHGGWSGSTPRVCRAAYRNGYGPFLWGFSLGFRVVRFSLAPF